MDSPQGSTQIDNTRLDICMYTCVCVCTSACTPLHSCMYVCMYIRVGSLTCSDVMLEPSLLTAAKYCMANLVASVLPAPLSPLHTHTIQKVPINTQKQSTATVERWRWSLVRGCVNLPSLRTPDDNALVKLGLLHVRICCTANGKDVSVACQHRMG